MPAAAAPAPVTPFRNRIVGSGEEAPDQLLANPRNWRIHPKHQQDAIQAVLEEVGWVQEIIVNKTTGFVVDGHARVSIALRREEAMVPVKYVELTEAEEALILATLDPIGALAVGDQEKVSALLADIGTESVRTNALLASLQEHDVLTALAAINEPKDQGHLLELIDVTVHDPKQATEHGELWAVGPHLLAVIDPVTEWWAMKPHMKRGDALFVYPGAYAALVEKKHVERFILLQPDPWIAGFIIDHYREVHDSGAMVRLITKDITDVGA